MSDDYIKRADAIELIARHDDTDGTIKVFSGRFVNGLISAVPPADVVEVVRCKDCKHNYRRTTWNHGARDNPSCKYTDYVRDNDFYCSYGERADT